MQSKLTSECIPTWRSTATQLTSHVRNETSFHRSHVFKQHNTAQQVAVFLYFTFAFACTRVSKLYLVHFSIRWIYLICVLDLVKIRLLSFVIADTRHSVGDTERVPAQISWMDNWRWYYTGRDMPDVNRIISWFKHVVSVTGRGYICVLKRSWFVCCQTYCFWETQNAS